jgi:hypothetical protein
MDLLKTVFGNAGCGVFVERAIIPSQIQLLVDVKFLVSEDCESGCEHRQRRARVSTHKRRFSPQQIMPFEQKSQYDDTATRILVGLQFIFLFISQLSQVDTLDLSTNGGGEKSDFLCSAEEILL